MEKGKILTGIVKCKIVAYRNENLSIREIVVRLNRSKNIISNYLKNPETFFYGSKYIYNRKTSKFIKKIQEELQELHLTMQLAAKRLKQY